MAITDSWLKATHKKHQEAAFEKADGGGLSARVSPTGKITFQMRYRWQGKAARLDLGSYPLLPLKAARAEHLRLKAELEQGRDPRVVRKVERTEAAEAHTNESLYRLWHESYCLAHKKLAKEILRSFEIYVFPEIGDLPAEETSTHTWMTLLENVADRVPAIAERLLREAKQMQKWAARRGLLKNRSLFEVSARSDLQIERKEAGRCLSNDEITLFWHAVEASRISPGSKLFLKLCLFFGCRNGELRSLNPREDLDFEKMLWTLPPEKHKVGRRVKKPVVRPLIPEVLPLLEEAMKLSRSPDLLFTQESGPAPLQSNAVLCFPYSVRRNVKRLFGVEMQHWSMHDLRKTARTNFSTLTDAHVAEVMLGHSLQGMQGVYDRHLYLEEQAAAYRGWWQRLDALSKMPVRC